MEGGKRRGVREREKESRTFPHCQLLEKWKRGFSPNTKLSLASWGPGGRPDSRGPHEVQTD